MLLVGFLSIGVAHFLLEHPWEAVVTALGASLIAAAHIVNFKLYKKSHQKI
jgi:hypothetical protein